MKHIWKKEISPKILNAFCRDTAVSHLGIEIISVGPDHVTATMPVDERTRQPFGLLHGGASVLLAESLSSIAANFAVDEPRRCVGLQINANHVRSVNCGTVTGTTRPLHLGRSTQLWDIAIVDEGNNLVCTARLTMAVLG